MSEEEEVTMETRALLLQELNPHLMCVLCGGYLIDATTITECLHSFCRTCILRYLESSKFCPICDVQVHKTKPQLYVRSDKTLQTLVYKLVPGLFKDEYSRRKEFYTSHPDAVKGSHAVEQDMDMGLCADSLELDLSRPLTPDLSLADELISLCLQHCEKLPPSRHRRPKHRLENRYLLCPPALAVRHLKKFLTMKYNLPPSYQISIFHSNESLANSYTLMDISNIYSWRRTEPLKLFYTVWNGELLSHQIVTNSIRRVVTIPWTSPDPHDRVRTHSSSHKKKKKKKKKKRKHVIEGGNSEKKEERDQRKRHKEKVKTKLKKKKSGVDGAVLAPSGEQERGKKRKRTEVEGSLERKVKKKKKKKNASKEKEVKNGGKIKSSDKSKVKVDEDGSKVVGDGEVSVDSGKRKRENSLCGIPLSDSCGVKDELGAEAALQQCQDAGSDEIQVPIDINEDYSAVVPDEGGGGELLKMADKLCHVAAASESENGDEQPNVHVCNDNGAGSDVKSGDSSPVKHEVCETQTEASGGKTNISVLPSVQNGALSQGDAGKGDSSIDVVSKPRGSDCKPVIAVTHFPIAAAVSPSNPVAAEAGDLAQVACSGDVVGSLLPPDSTTTACTPSEDIPSPPSLEKSTAGKDNKSACKSKCDRETCKTRHSSRLLRLTRNGGVKKSKKTTSANSGLVLASPLKSPRRNRSVSKMAQIKEKFSRLKKRLALPDINRSPGSRHKRVFLLRSRKLKR